MQVHRLCRDKMSNLSVEHVKDFTDGFTIDHIGVTVAWTALKRWNEMISKTLHTFAQQRSADVSCYCMTI